MRLEEREREEEEGGGGGYKGAKQENETIEEESIKQNISQSIEKS